MIEQNWLKRFKEQSQSNQRERLLKVAVAPLASTATLADVINKVNEILNAIKEGQ
jgi:hypothetical protein